MNVAPPSNDEFARIGRRWISFEPVTTFAGFAGLIAMNVSLCDPHSWLASTFSGFPGNESCCASPEFDVHGSGSGAETERYFSYQDAPS